MSLVEWEVGGGDIKVDMVRTIGFKVSNSSINSDITRLELDSHAGTTILVKGCLVVHDFYRTVNVTRYDP